METDDIFQLMRVLGIDTAEEAMQVLGRYFPASAQDAGKQRFQYPHGEEAEGRLEPRGLQEARWRDRQEF